MVVDQPLCPLPSGGGGSGGAPGAATAAVELALSRLRAGRPLLCLRLFTLASFETLPRAAAAAAAAAPPAAAGGGVEPSREAGRAEALAATLAEVHRLAAGVALRGVESGCGPGSSGEQAVAALAALVAARVEEAAAACRAGPHAPPRAPLLTPHERHAASPLGRALARAAAAAAARPPPGERLTLPVIDGAGWLDGFAGGPLGELDPITGRPALTEGGGGAFAAPARRARRVVNATSAAAIAALNAHADAGGLHFSHTWGPPHVERRTVGAPPALPCEGTLFGPAKSLAYMAADAMPADRLPLSRGGGKVTLPRAFAAAGGHATVFATAPLRDVPWRPLRREGGGGGGTAKAGAPAPPPPPPGAAAAAASKIASLPKAAPAPAIAAGAIGVYFPELKAAAGLLGGGAEAARVAAAVAAAAAAAEGGGGAAAPAPAAAPPAPPAPPTTPLPPASRLPFPSTTSIAGAGEDCGALFADFACAPGGAQPGGGEGGRAAVDTGHYAVLEYSERLLSAPGFEPLVGRVKDRRLREAEGDEWLDSAWGAALAERHLPPLPSRPPPAPPAPPAHAPPAPAAMAEESAPLPTMPVIRVAHPPPAPSGEETMAEEGPTACAPRAGGSEDAAPPPAPPPLAVPGDGSEGGGGAGCALETPRPPPPSPPPAKANTEDAALCGACSPEKVAALLLLAGAAGTRRDAATARGAEQLDLARTRCAVLGYTDSGAARALKRARLLLGLPGQGVQAVELLNVARHDSTAVQPAMATAGSGGGGASGALGEWSACEDMVLLRAVAQYGANWELVRDRVRATSAAGNTLLPGDFAWVQAAPRGGRPLSQFASGRMRSLRTTRACFDRFRKLVYANKTLQVVVQSGGGGGGGTRTLLRVAPPPLAPGRRNAPTAYPPGFYVGRWAPTRPAADRVLYFQAHAAAAVARAGGGGGGGGGGGEPPAPRPPPQLDVPIYSRYRPMARLMEGAFAPASKLLERRWSEEVAALRDGCGARPPPAGEPDTHESHLPFQPGLAAALALPARAAAAAAGAGAAGEKGAGAGAAAEAAAPEGGLGEAGRKAAALLRAPAALAASLPPFAGSPAVGRVMLLTPPDADVLSRAPGLRAVPCVPPPTPDIVAQRYAPKAVPYRDRCPWVQGVRAQLGAIREARAAAAAQAAASASAASASATPAALSDAALNDLFARVLRTHVLSINNVSELIRTVVGCAPEKQPEWLAASLTRAEKIEIVQLYTTEDVAAETRLKKTANIMGRLLDKREP
jgi:hypothetical protein